MAQQDPSAFDAELERIGEEGTIDARGVELSAELLERILRAAPRENDRPIFKGDAGFERATFGGAAAFGGATFEGDARFDGATFEGDARFDGATFKGAARLGGATFKGAARFERAIFAGTTGFIEATFEGAARFERASFAGAAWFIGAIFGGAARFGGATFEGTAWFGGATFKGDAGFIGATLKGAAGFGEATFEGTAWFDRATFEQARGIGPLLARQLFLDEADFRERVQLDVAAAALSARRAQFPAGVQFRLRWASVALDDADLAAPAILEGVVEPFPKLGDHEQNAVRGWELPPEPLAQQGRPRLLSLCRADVAGLRVANVDLQACRFVGAHNLDRLRIEGEPLFARAPGWWRTRRKTLAEEQHWRASRPGRWRQRGWYPQACQPPPSLRVKPPAMLAPVQVAALYRELRKGREDAKDEPGAADFYYGEMEMRRHTQHELARQERRRGHWGTWAAARVEHAVVWLYWLLSGYALRAWRALAALTVVVLVAAVAFAFWGFPASEPSFRPVGVGRDGVLVYQQRPAEPPPGFGRLLAAVRFSARSATALLRGPDRALTPLGEWLEIALRFLGPVLLGLAVLSVRGRVRR